MSKTTELRLKEFLNELSKLSNKYDIYLVAGYINGEMGLFDQMTNTINMYSSSGVILCDLYYDFGSRVYK